MKTAFAHLRPVGAGMTPHREVARDQTLSRFASVKADPARINELRADHPALTKGRTLFPSTVVGAFDSPRFLVSGHNNPKLGADVRKGPWKGFPIYHLTLEERATCPRSCPLWRGCYGNAMHLARRHDHRDPLFLETLRAEVLTAARAHRDGFVVRLHTLGDFFSVAYVQLWAGLLDRFQNLHVFGYTARREDADDEESREIALAIRRLTDRLWDRFAIRFSGQDAPQGAVVVNSEAEATRVGAILCPAQSHKTAACATCGLCWAPAARDKTIAFLRHGMAGRGRPRLNEHKPRGPVGRPRIDYGERGAEWRRRYEAGESVAQIAPRPNMAGAVRAAIIRAGGKMRSHSEAAALRWKTVRKPPVRDSSPPKSALRFSPGEQQALIAQALAAGKLTFCKPGRAKL